MKEGTSFEKHLKNMRELTEQLAVIGAPIDEEDQVVTLLGSLPKSYSTFVTALQARETVSLTYLQQALTQEEQKLQGYNPQRDAVLVGETRRRKQHQKPVCFGCPQPGHFRRDCPKARRAPPGSRLLRTKRAGRQVVHLQHQWIALLLQHGWWTPVHPVT